MKRFIASGFGVGIVWSSLFGDQKGGVSSATKIIAAAIATLATALKIENKSSSTASLSSLSVLFSLSR